jgi:hypothetical protein
MYHEPIDINLDRAATATREEQPRRRSNVGPYFVPKPKHAAPPEAFDEVFATLAHESMVTPIEMTEENAKPSLQAASLVALSENLERQHERIAALLREIDAVTSI